MFYGKKFDSLEELEQAIHKYIKFYNEDRFQKKLGCLAPVEFRNQASSCI
ncbi:IS3 family transposase [Petrotoga sp. 9PW.55.5.1]|nr:IS3 family transposase [Petrotoga sp. 9PW.55.5.1]